MNNLLFFYRSCIFFNFISTVYFLSIYTHIIDSQFIKNAINAFFVINIIKIFNQNSIIKYLIMNISNIYERLLTFDGIIDFIKFIVCSYLITNQNNVCSNWYMCIGLVIIYINYILIVCHAAYKCRAMRRRQEIQDDIVRYIAQIQHTEIYVPMEPSYDIINYTVTKTNNNTCSICLEEQQTGETWSKLYCEHEFHKKCINNWLHVNSICPVCRQSINNVNNVNNVNNINNVNNVNNVNNDAGINVINNV